MGIKHLVFVGLLAAGVPLFVSAQGLGPEGFVRADVEAREATLGGMVLRVAQIETGTSLEQQFESAEATRAEVDAVFNKYGTTGAAHAAYGTHHGEEIAAWLEANSDWQARYEELNAQFEALSQQLDALRGGN